MAAQDKDDALVRQIFAVSRSIVHLANQEFSRIRFLRAVTDRLLRISDCDLVEIRLFFGHRYLKFTGLAGEKTEFRYAFMPTNLDRDGAPLPCFADGSRRETLCEAVAKREAGPEIGCFTLNESFWTAAPDSLRTMETPDERWRELLAAASAEIPGSMCLIPVQVGDDPPGLLRIESRQQGALDEIKVGLFEILAQTLGVAVASRQSQLSLRERVKELTCLYGIAKIAESTGASLPEIYEGIVRLLPPAWQHPEITHGRILVDGRRHVTDRFQEGSHHLAAPIVVKGQNRGAVEVHYAEDRPELDEGPFLREERNLIDAVAVQLSLIIERKQAEAEHARLQDQLRHADRLATIGQLAAGVAHEVNEPIGNILGFAQLSQKIPGLPVQANRDLQSIVNASLHAREIVRKLLLFARQTPPETTAVVVNRIVEDGLFFLESRCAKQSITVRRELAEPLPEIMADPNQLNQVLVNLAVNAIQSMPHGGTLTIATEARPDKVRLSVADTGFGMTEEVMKQVFVPFFSTKDVNEGTGLGLAVVHGIVTSHGGTITVQSIPGEGSRFTVELPVAGPEEFRT